jgi:DNA-directed RNA polymerase specialized sigma24 family protein
MSGLTEEQQAVLTMRFGQGFSLDETAQMMKKNANAIKQLQFRALAALNRALGEML